MTWAVGIDTGGTFTDVIGMHTGSGEIRTLKVPSVPSDPSVGVVDGVKAFLAASPDVRAADISFFAHGTTVATNAVVERKGAATGLLITRGTSGVYLARMSRQAPTSEMLNPAYQKPAPLVPPRLTREIPERVISDGSVETRLDEAAVVAAVEDLVRQHDIESLAVCYLFSFMNPRHEQRTRELVLERFPQLRVSISSDIVPIIREYRRISTTALDAYVGPSLESYLTRMHQGLRDLGMKTKQVFIMQSNGGLMSIRGASSNPVHTLLSGPAAGVISGAYLAELTGMRNVVTFDVGGTTTDISTILDGQLTETTKGSVAGQDVAVPMNEIVTFGAGGCSIAGVGSDGRLKVGPHSAGADPGPVCFGRGGKEPTVTDADLVLGHLDPEYFLGGKYILDPDLARRAIAQSIAEPLGLSLEEAAAGIVTVVNNRMESQLRLALMSRGFDPGEFALVALGGGGPLRACMVAKGLGIRTVIIPPFPGLGSAMGLLLTDVRHNYMLSRLHALNAVAADESEATFNELLQRARNEAEAEGTAAETIVHDLLLDLRYVGQGYELTIPCPSARLTDSVKQTLAQRFHQAHLKMYGHEARNKHIEVVNFRLTSTGKLARLGLRREDKEAAPAAVVPKNERRVWMPEAQGWVQLPVYDRAALPAGAVFAGPALVEQVDATALIASGQTARVDAYGNLIIVLEEPSN